MDKEEIDIRFTYHAPAGDKAQIHATIRGHARGLATLLEELVPECREKSLAITKLEEVVMWANAAVARRK